MNMIVSPTLTVEEFEKLPDHRGYELIDGYLREKARGAESSEIQSDAHYWISRWAKQTRLGKVYGAECMYRCFPSHPDGVRKPDVSFVRRDRLPEGRSPIGVFTLRPDFVAEVVSPGDTICDLDEKLADYRDAKIPLVWVLHPNRRTVQVRTPDRIVGEFDTTAELTADPVLPGFRVRVADLFPPPIEPASAESSGS